MSGKRIRWACVIVTMLFPAVYIYRDIYIARRGQGQILSAYYMATNRFDGRFSSLPVPEGGSRGDNGHGEYYISQRFSVWWPTWTLWCTFKSNVIVSAQIRTADGRDCHPGPDRAPPDWIRSSE